MVLYHSGGKPSVPGDLLLFRLKMASSISSCDWWLVMIGDVIGMISLSLISLPMLGRSSEFRNSIFKKKKEKKKTILIEAAL